MRFSIFTVTKVFGCTAALAASFFLAANATAATLQVEGVGLNNFADEEQVRVNDICSINQPGGAPACASTELVVSTGVVRSGINTGIGAGAAYLTTGQVKAYASRGQSGGTSGGSGRGSLTEVVSMNLAPGASWPQSFTVRLVLDGTFSRPHNGEAGSTSYWGFFREPGQSDGLDVTANPFTSELPLPTVHLKVFSISAPTDFNVSATLSVGAYFVPGLTADFSTRTLYGLRFEVDLPPGLVMTSESGVFLTEDPQDEPIILPPPPPPGVPDFRMPVPGFQLPQARKYDPPVVLGYEYEAIGGRFATVVLPTDIGDGLYEVEVYDDGTGDYVFLQSLAGGASLCFELDTVTRFRVLGIEPEAGLDPNDTEAFVTELAFTGPVTELVMTPISGEVVPLMTLWSMGALATALVSLGAWSGVRRSRH